MGILHNCRTSCSRNRRAPRAGSPSTPPAQIVAESDAQAKAPAVGSRRHPVAVAAGEAGGAVAALTLREEVRGDDGAQLSMAAIADEGAQLTGCPSGRRVLVAGVVDRERRR